MSRNLNEVFLFLLLFFFLSTISGCSTTKKETNTVSRLGSLSNLYCDSFMIYTMCAEDLTGDGQVDLFFFEDDDQVFFYREDSLEQVTKSHLFHPCMQKMSNDLILYGSELFLISEESDLVKRISLQTKLIGFYISYLPIISSCQKSTLKRENDSNSSFNDFEEFF